MKYFNLNINVSLFLLNAIVTLLVIFLHFGYCMGTEGHGSVCQGPLPLFFLTALLTPLVIPLCVRLTKQISNMDAVIIYVGGYFLLGLILGGLFIGSKLF